MNTYLHFHLLKTIIDFRPFYSYWCFSYKHFNAVLGSYAINHHSVCLQIMKTFKIHHVPLQACLKTYIVSLALQMETLCAFSTMGYSSQFSSVQLSMTDIISPIAVKSLCIGNINAVKFHSSDSSYLLHPINQSFFSSQEMHFLDYMYNIIYNSSYIFNNIPRLYEHSADASLNNSRFNSVKSLTNQSSYVCAYWVESNGNYNTRPLLGKILKFVKHQIEVMSVGNVMKHIIISFSIYSVA